MSLVQFLSFGRGQRGGTPVGFTLGRRKKTSFTSFVPPFHPYLAKVKEIFFWHSPSPVAPASCSQYLKRNCHAEIEKYGHRGKVHPCIYPASYIHSCYCFLKCQGRGSLNKTSVSHWRRIFLGMN